MKLRTFVVSVALILISATTFAQTGSDEHAVIATALSYHLDVAIRYAPEWAIGIETEPLAFGDFDVPEIRGDTGNYEARNQTRINIGEIALPAKATAADLSQFSKAGVFDWSAFEQQVGPGVWTARVSRPGFVTPGFAVVRIDVCARDKRLPLSTLALVAKSGNGSWTFVRAYSKPLNIKR